jgi:ribonuclease VapC
LIVDTSAIIAIVRLESDAERYTRAIEEATECRISAANLLESAIVLDGGRDPIVSRRFDDLCREARLLIEPVTEAQARIAREAYRDFGKGSGHPAQLNFGDCFAYALAKDLREPLLFKGADFSRTDISSALT